MDALAELDEAVAVEPDPRDVALCGLVDEGLRRRAEGLPLGHPDEPLQLGREVEGDGRVVRRHEVVDEVHGEAAGRQAHLLLHVLVDDVVLAVRAGRAGLAVPGLGARQGLELERDVLGDVAHPRPVAQARDEAAAAAERAGVVAQAGHERQQAVGEAGDAVGGIRLEAAQVHQHADDRLARPVVGPAHDPRLDDAQLGLRSGGVRFDRRVRRVRLAHAPLPTI